MNAFLRLVVAVGFLGFVVLACGPSGAQKRAQDGVNALDACDMRTAHDAFSDAYAMDPSDPGIALAFALTDVVLLPEDPTLQALAPRFGFTAPFDTSFMWQKGGFMDLASQKTTTCGALGDLVRANVAHPSLAQNNPTPFLQTIDQTMTFGDLVTAGVALSPRLDKLSHALETAANGTNGDGVGLQGGCGAGNMVLQKPELYVLAGTFALLEATFQLAAVYDGGVHVYPVFMQIAGEQGVESNFVSDMNASFLHVADASQAAAAKTLFQRAFTLFVSGASAATAITKTPANAVIDWTSFPKTILADGQTIAQSAHDIFDAPGALPFVSPAITVDGPSFIATPIELAPLTPPAFTLSGTDVSFTFDPMSAKLGARMTPDPFSSNASYSWSFVDDISNASKTDWWTPTFDPGQRFTSTFACTN